MYPTRIKESVRHTDIGRTVSFYTSAALSPAARVKVTGTLTDKDLEAGTITVDATIAEVVSVRREGMCVEDLLGKVSFRLRDINDYRIE